MSKAQFKPGDRVSVKDCQATRNSWILSERIGQLGIIDIGDDNSMSPERHLRRSGTPPIGWVNIVYQDGEELSTGAQWIEHK